MVFLYSALSSDGKICYLSAENSVQIWDLIKFEKIKTVNTNGTVLSCKYFKNTIIFTTNTGFIYKNTLNNLNFTNFNTENKKSIHGLISNIDIGNTEEIFVTSSSDNLVHLWKNGKKLVLVDIILMLKRFLYLVTKDILCPTIMMGKYLWNVENNLDYYHLPFESNKFIFSEDSNHIIYTIEDSNKSEIKCGNKFLNDTRK